MSLPPSGEIPQGAIRFNIDSQRLEFYAQGEWWVMSTDTPNLAESGDNTPGARGLTGGGYAPAAHNEIMFWNIASLSSGADFGDLTENKGYTAGVSSRTRAVWGGGTSVPVGSAVDTLEFITMSSKGNGTTFGELNDADRLHMGATSNQTRGIFGGGETPTRVDIIEYITIASTGDSKDFGDLSSIREAPGAVSSPTRAVFAGGISPGGTSYLNTIEFVTISTLGNAEDFGDLPQGNGGNGGGSNAVRGLFGGGANGPNSIIDYLTIASTGNAAKFGDLTVSRRYSAAASSSTRCTWVGGISPGLNDRMDYVEFATEGNAIDFGDLNNTNNPGTGSGCSNAHGGL